MSCINFYQSLPDEYKEAPIEYSGFSTVQISLPKNILVVGGSGSGKTNWVMNFITATNAFTRFLLCIKNCEEPLYASLIDNLREVEKKLKQDILIVVTDITQLPPVTALDKEESTLFICDDMVTEKSKDLAKVAEYFIRGRKENCTSAFLSQDFYKTPGIIRSNCQITVITLIQKIRNLNFICREFDKDKTDKEIKELYERATKDGFPNVFILDPHHKDPRYRYRRNFEPMDVIQEVNQPFKRKRQLIDDSSRNDKRVKIF